MSVMELIMDSNWSELTTHVEKLASDKIKQKIDLKKQDVIERLNAGFDSEE